MWKDGSTEVLRQAQACVNAPAICEMSFVCLFYGAEEDVWGPSSKSDCIKRVGIGTFQLTLV